MSDDEGIQCSIVNETKSSSTVLSHTKDQLVNEIDVIHQPTESSSKQIAEISNAQSKRNLKKINIAPGEMGSFKNWGEDIYLEEMAFPDKFPFGCGG